MVDNWSLLLRLQEAGMRKERAGCLRMVVWMEDVSLQPLPDSEGRHLVLNGLVDVHLEVEGGR